MRFQGKNVVITGGNSGIGLATAKAFVREGARVAIIGRSAETLAAARAELGKDAIAISAELSRVAEIDRAFAEVRAAFGTVDVLFANAGGGGMIPFEQVDEALWDQIIDLNVKGTYFTVQRCLPLMGKGGAIILCSSVSAARSMPGASVYAASKAAINSLGRSLGGELVGRGIRVNVVMPGGVQTPIMQRTPGVPAELANVIFEKMAQGTPMGRVGQPDEIASAVLFLASPEASYITATELHVDGGVIGAT
ncbi:MAG: SDR family oxidoreductase [Gammaproteobacteria bacterium]|jgi:NAD(P)-dependent dehydrogenase (short-subunit alcohol dehydrogenase family)|nr:SDR family oxidoreductase [Pseudomonadota bacterium]MCC6633343.1 SDR family oxidoreductase [Gammaproteobacteria bacterium]